MEFPKAIGTLAHRVLAGLWPTQRTTWTREGLGYLLVWLALLFTGLYHQINLIMLVAGLAFGPILASFVSSSAVLRKLRVTRRVPPYVFADEPIHFDYTLENERRRTAALALIVEDDLTVRELAAALLEESDLRVVECEDAEEALATLCKHGENIALIFADVRLPGLLDGVDLALRVKVLWPREEDLAQDKQRPLAVAKLTAAIGDDGLPTALFTRAAWFTQDAINQVGGATAHYGIYNVRNQIVTVPGAVLPLPYGGKARQIMIDLDPRAMAAYGLSGQDINAAINAQNLTLPSGHLAIGVTTLLGSSSVTSTTAGNIVAADFNGGGKPGVALVNL